MVFGDLQILVGGCCNAEKFLQHFRLAVNKRDDWLQANLAIVNDLNVLATLQGIHGFPKAVLDNNGGGFWETTAGLKSTAVSCFRDTFFKVFLGGFT